MLEQFVRFVLPQVDDEVDHGSVVLSLPRRAVERHGSEAGEQCATPPEFRRGDTNPRREFDLGRSTTQFGEK